MFSQVFNNMPNTFGCHGFQKSLLLKDGIGGSVIAVPVEILIGKLTLIEAGIDDGLTQMLEL